MFSSTREEIQEGFGALHAAVSRILAHSFDVLTTPERLALLERLEQETRRLRVPRHALINQVAERSDSTELGGKLPHVLADRLRITRGEASRRIAEAADLGPRGALTGEPLPPLLTATAAAERAGEIDAQHVKVIRRFFDRLPCSVDIGNSRSCRKASRRAFQSVSPGPSRGLGRRARRLHQSRRHLHRRRQGTAPLPDAG